MKKKQWKVDSNGRRWFLKNSEALWVPVTKSYCEETVRKRKKLNMNGLMREGMLGVLKGSADVLVAILQRDGLTDEAWEEVAQICEIADISWAARRNARGLRRTKATYRREQNLQA
jgi:hypothetical protein